FKLSLAGGDTSQGSQPWAVSPPPTVLQIKRQFEIHPCSLYYWEIIFNLFVFNISLPLLCCSIYPFFNHSNKAIQFFPCYVRK
ncbi:MAG: hypothetical protein ABIP10_12075, partial [Ferruginibacter sp.]